jgi:inner membrane protein
VIAGTHVAFASLLYLGGATLFGYQPDWLGWVLAGAASVLPDVDLPTSTLGRWLFWLSSWLEKQFGHRTVTHSAMGMALAALLASPLWLVRPLYFWCALGGYWSHVWLDMLNVRGVDLFWPSLIRVVMPGKRDWRMEVGSKAEMILLSTLVVLTVALYPLSHLGFRDSLQLLIANFDIARDAYLKQAGTHWYELDLKATDNLTLQHVECRCPVLGVWQNGLIVLHEGKPRAVGESQASHNLYPLHARLLEGPPLTVVSEKVDLRGRTLRWLLSRIDQSRTYYLLGELEIAGKKLAPVDNLNLYRPATYRGNVLRLHYAREEELGPWLDLVAAQGEVYVQFWLKPGEAAVELMPGEEKPVERIPEQLQKFL